ncbi:amino acid ABC transporter permease [Clostridium sp.]|uniref:amino acid ABC transporter permease n=1 Tax=Clostridium sp. TaxID=1506 RepID=UPI002605C8D0|nr:amino acid ABC transporter permease [Clostridium sp.]
MKNILEIIPQLLEGLKVTIKIFIITLVLSIPLGIIVAQFRISKIKVLKYISGIYVTVFRGTPLLLQILFIFFGLPYIASITIDRFPAAILAMVLNYGAYFGEIFRAGILSIDKGQYEAADILGLSKRDTFFRIIMPQSIRIIFPPVANEVITLVKDTSLIYVVGLDELLKIAKIAANRLSSIMPFVVVGIVYLIFNTIISKLLEVIEKRFNYYE